MIRTYSEMSKLKTFEERYEYLKIKRRVGESTFGFERYLNQHLYVMPRWKSARDFVIIRDNACDLGVEGHELDFGDLFVDPITSKKIKPRIIVHHMNPLTIKDLEELDDSVFDPEFLVCVSHRTHEAIHFGDANLIPKGFVERRPGDTKLW